MLDFWQSETSVSRVSMNTANMHFSIKGISNGFRAGLRDPCTRDVARLSESVKMLEPQASRVFLRFLKVE